MTLKNKNLYQITNINVWGTCKQMIMWWGTAKFYRSIVKSAQLCTAGKVALKVSESIYVFEEVNLHLSHPIIWLYSAFLAVIVIQFSNVSYHIYDIKQAIISYWRMKILILFRFLILNTFAIYIAYLSKGKIKKENTFQHFEMLCR